MKVLFLTAKREAPSTKWRVLQFIPHFLKAGLACDVEEWPAGMIARLSMTGRAAAYDLVFLQKRLMPKLLVNRLRKHARALVFEFDDVLTLKRAEDGSVADSPTRDRRFSRIIKAADAVVTTNEVLAEMARRLTDSPERVNVFPTVIDLARWRPRVPREATDAVTLGWMGTASNLSSLEVLRQPFVRLCRRHAGLQVKVVCEEPFAMEDVRLIRWPYTADGEVEDVRSFDIAVAPLIEAAWTRGKVSTKILAYFAAGLPVVASDVNANRTYVRSGENGFLVGTLGDWEERLNRLVEDPALRRQLGGNARESAEKEYSIESAVPKYLALFEKLVTKT